MPRKVPLSLLSELLICTKRVSSPASVNSRSQNTRAKKPRSSSRLSSSMTTAPASGVGTNRMAPSGGLSPRLLRHPVQAMTQGAQPHELLAVEIAGRETVRAVPRQQLFHAGGEGVFESKIGQQSAELAEIDAVVARVLADLAGVDDVGARHEALDDRGDVAHLIILRIAADVDPLVVNDLARDLEKGDEGTRDVLAVDQRAPRTAVAHDADVAFGDGAAEKVVDDEVDAQHRRMAVRSRVAQIGRREVGVGQRRDARFGHDLRLRVYRDRVERVLLAERAAFGPAVDRAARREQEARHTGCLGGTRQGDRASGVDRTGDFRVEIAHRVVGDRGEVHHAIKAVEVSRAQRSHITLDFAIRLRHRLPAATREQVEVAASDIVPGLLQKPNQMGADIAAMAGNQDLHLTSPRGHRSSVRAQGALPDSHNRVRYSWSRWVSMHAQKCRC